MDLEFLSEYADVIFDLDGTLIDSRESILLSLHKAFEEYGVYGVDYSKFVMGPPIKESIFLMLSDAAEGVVEDLVFLFKKHYDSYGYKECVLFYGIEMLLTDLKINNKKLHVVTNKRSVVTKKIMKLCPVFKSFDSVYCLDTHWNNKTELMAAMLEEENIEIDSSVYIGDTNDDMIAAHSNNLDFILMNHLSEAVFYPK